MFYCAHQKYSMLSYQLILFKPGMVIDATELYNLILDQVILTFIQGSTGAGKQTILRQLSKKVSN